MNKKVDKIEYDRIRQPALNFAFELLYMQGLSVQNTRSLERTGQEFCSGISLWLIRYFLIIFVCTPSTPCRDVKFCPTILLGDLSRISLTEVM